MNLAFIQGIGPTELIIVLVIVLVIFGPKRLPSLARSLGGGIREFKSSIGGKSDDDELDMSHARRTDSTADAQAALGRPQEPAAAAPATERSAESAPVAEPR